MNPIIVAGLICGLYCAWRYRQDQKRPISHQTLLSQMRRRKIGVK